MHPSNSYSGRLHGFDALRATALLLGILLHAGESFIPNNRNWAIVDRSTSLSVLVAVFVIHIFRLAAFFFMAGFFARLVCERKGLRAFLGDRGKRILIPLAGGWVIVYPFIICAWIWGMQVSGGGSLPPQARSMPPWLVTGFAILRGEAFRDAGFAHLWFLYYLLMLYVLLAAAAPLMRIPPAMDRLFERLAGGAAGNLLLALPAAVALAFTPQRFGVPTPDRGYVPDVRTLAAYGSFFLAGWLLHRRPALLETLVRRRKANLSLAVAFTILVVPAFLSMAKRNESGSVASPGQWVYSAGYALAMWFWVWGLSGWFLARFSRPGAWWRYLSDSSYFLYLAHLPLVAFLQVAVARLPWHWSLKLALILLIAIPTLLIAYRYLVRATWIGALLNGRRRPRGFEPEESSSEHASRTACLSN